MTNIYPNATKEMKEWVANMNLENSKKSQKRESILQSIRNKRDEIADAVIGTGMALKVLSEQKIEIEKKLNTKIEELAYVDPSPEFQKKFGLSMWTINFNAIPSQKEVDEIKIKEESNE